MAVSGARFQNCARMIDPLVEREPWLKYSPGVVTRRFRGAGYTQVGLQDYDADRAYLAALTSR
jgi:hypothetical protein